jgi:hypothetical protein
MRKWLLVLGLAGAAWMTIVLYLRSLRLAIISNYPGFFLARWCVHYGGNAPSLWTLWMFNGLLVLTSSLEWVIVGIIAWGIARRFSK